MVDVVLFGTGSNGERAWRAAARREDINVVCFADNDPHKCGVELHERPIVAPDALRARRWDFIVLATMYAPEIVRQLHGLGFPADCVVAPDPNQFAEAFAELPARKRATRPIQLDDDTVTLERELPPTLVVTGGALSLDDEASVPVRTILADFPMAALCNISRTTIGRPWLPRPILLADTDETPSLTLSRELGHRAFQPRLIFAAVRDAGDLTLLESTLLAVPDTAPVVVYLAGGDPSRLARFEDRMLASRPGPYELWSAGAPLADALRTHSRQPVTALAPSTVELVVESPRTPPQARRRSGTSRPRAVMLGGIADGATLALIQRAWRICRTVTSSLPPIDWYAQPADVQAVIERGGELGDDIVWRGSFSGHALARRLRAADLALVPVNASGSASTERARLEVPVRLAELCAAGLPLLAVASADTATAQLLDSWTCGISVSGPDEMAIATGILDLAGDTERLATLGGCARTLAEQELASAQARTLAVSRMVRLARAYTPPSDWRGPREPGLVRLAGSEHARSARLEDVLTDRIHYACGRNVLSGWLNVDGYDESFPNGEIPDEIACRIFRLDLTGRHPFPDGAFRLGYSEDFIEHIDQADFTAFLCECYRTFQPGGVLRLSSPGLEGILRRHLRGSDWNAANVLREEAYTRWWHKHFLSHAEVGIIARHIGWRDVRVTTYGESTLADLCQDTRPQQADLNLVVELVK